jgi:hypothetical protein
MSTLSLKRSISQEYESKSFMLADVSPREDMDDDVEATPMNGPGLSFTRKLFDMLESPESEGIIMWTPGTYFIIYQYFSVFISIFLILSIIEN